MAAVLNEILDTNKSLANKLTVKYCFNFIIEKHCENRGINLISCNLASKLVENDDDIKYSSFRLCVPAEEYGKVMTASNWPASVVVREWIFNKDNTNSSNTLPNATTNASAMKDVNNTEENSGVSKSDI
ncbi:hypothetical protein HELRODRAFT_166799 [Helobdella robusta]|uniref:Uncharacterized protein n=1 Tax=Helobdella robusta TaxID=6412 RepID=T1EYJ4_HELRO|nr:hypothetical protein HELRODRAFT_166799 [Helobdella robusta]ESO11762.1 hypothetical protein HELRODRAFT_166799 [Helobdella robusta]